MKIAIAAEGKMVSHHFGHSEGFIVYEKLNNDIISKNFLKNPGHRPGFLPIFIKEKNIDLVITGGMGDTAKELFKDIGVDIVIGARGECDEVIEQYLKGKLKLAKNVCAGNVSEEEK